jgi:pilus assembly protein CpaC
MVRTVDVRSTRKFALAGLAFLALLIGIEQASGSTPESTASSIIKIPSDAALPVTKRGVLGLNKAMIVELPVDAQDVLVSQPNVVDVTVLTARRIIFFAKTAGEANAFVLGRDGRKVLIIDITVKRDFQDLSTTLQKLLPGSRISLTTTGEGVVLSGSVASPIDAGRAGDIATQYLGNTKVVNLITAGHKEQILLKVTVAELQREAIRRLGINLPAAVDQAGTFTFTKIIQNGLPVSGVVSTAARYIAPNSPPGISTGSALQATKTWGNGDSATVILESLERVGLARTLAEPTLIATSGETAKFHAGGEFPIPTSQQNGVVTVTWKEFGVSVAFTPYVLSEGRISLKVAAEVSELSGQGAVQLANFAISAVQKRRAETVLEMPSGSALAMAGLLSEQTRQNVDGVPELRKIPILGSLFQSKDYRNNLSELVILTTPYIVRPTEQRALSRPDEALTSAAPLSGLLLGHLNRVYKSVPPNLTAGGAFGFVLDYPDHGAKH